MNLKKEAERRIGQSANKDVFWINNVLFLRAEYRYNGYIKIYLKRGKKNG